MKGLDNTVEGLIKFLEGQDPTTRYNYVEPDSCLCARFFQSQGFVASVDPIGVRLQLGTTKKSIPLGEGLNAIAWGEADAEAWTYGNALERARHFLRNKEQVKILEDA